MPNAAEEANLANAEGAAELDTTAITVEPAEAPAEVPDAAELERREDAKRKAAGDTYAGASVHEDFEGKSLHERLLLQPPFQVSPDWL